MRGLIARKQTRRAFGRLTLAAAAGLSGSSAASVFATRHAGAAPLVQGASGRIEGR